jgi:small GTP-binding protein
VTGVRAWLASPSGRGGVAIIDLQADDADALNAVLAAIAPGAPVRGGDWRPRRLADIDDGVVARLDDRHAQLMPHGGPAIVRRIAFALQAAGADWLREPPGDHRIEANDEIESLALEIMPRAASPAAIPILLRQSSAWRARTGPLDAEELERTARLDRLVTPATIACIGAPNAGKSTLLNAMARTQAAIVSALPGTTRDRVSRRIEFGGVVVEWIDTPGLRDSDDPIEQAAIAASLPAIRGATLIVHLTSPDTENAVIPDGLAPSEGVLRVVNKLDLDPSAAELADLAISAGTGEGVVKLAQAVRERLVRAEDLEFHGRWAFDPRLRALTHGCIADPTDR